MKLNKILDVEQIKNDENVVYFYEFVSDIKKEFLSNYIPNYVIVVKEYAYTEYNNVDVFIINDWFQQIETGTLLTFKCNALKPKYKHKEYVYFTPKLEIINLRVEIQSYYDNCLVEMKQTFEKGEFAKGKQFLYNAFECVIWGIEIMINRKITHINIPDDYFINIILNPNNTYEFYEKEYLNKLNSLLIEFMSFSNNAYQEHKLNKLIKNYEQNQK